MSSSDSQTPPPRRSRCKCNNLGLVRPKFGDRRSTRVERLPLRGTPPCREHHRKRPSKTTASEKPAPSDAAETLNPRCPPCPVYACPPGAVCCQYPVYCCPPWVCCPLCVEATGNQRDDTETGKDEAKNEDDDDDAKQDDTPPPAPVPPPKVTKSKRKAHHEVVESKHKIKVKSLDGSGDSGRGSSSVDDYTVVSSRRPMWDGIKVHFCLRCGRYRSRSFHYAHPTKRGQKPLEGYCSLCKCQLPYDSPFGLASGAIRGERFVITPIETRRRGSARYERKRAEKLEKERMESRVQELSDSDSAYESGSKGGSDTGSESEDDGKGKRPLQEKKPEPPNKKAAPQNGASPPERIPRSRPPTQPHVNPVSSEKPPTAEEKAEQRRRDIDHRIAAHPGAWSVGRMMPVERGSPAPSPNSRPSPQNSDQDQQSGPEWVYRHVTRRVIHDPYGSFHRGQDVRDAKTEPEPRRAPPPKGHSRDNHRYAHSPPPPAPSPPAPRDPRDHPPSRDHPPPRRPANSSSGSSDSTRHPHVRFAADAKNERNERPRRAPVSAARDNMQEDRDHGEMEARKQHVRHRLHKGGGAFEIDGHHSEDRAEMRGWMVSESTADVAPCAPGVVECWLDDVSVAPDGRSVRLLDGRLVHPEALERVVGGWRVMPPAGAQVRVGDGKGQWAVPDWKKGLKR